MKNLTAEEKDDLNDFSASDLHPIVKKYLESVYQEQVRRFVAISATEKDKLSIEKAKLEGMKTTLDCFNNLRRKKEK